MEGHDYSTDAGTGESIYHADFDEDIPGPSHERYMKMRLDRNNMVTVLEMGDPEDLTLPASFSYTFDGSRLGGVVFSGDYADYMNIISIDGDSMVLELVDKGQDEETIDDWSLSPPRSFFPRCRSPHMITMPPETRSGSPP